MLGSELQALNIVWNVFSGSILGPFAMAMLFTLGFILQDALFKPGNAVDRENLRSDMS